MIPEVGGRFARLGGPGRGVAMIEWARVRELRDEIGIDDFGEIVVLFLEEADEVVSRLGGNNRQRSVADDLHFLKGAALNLGFSDFAGSCPEGEGRIAA